MIKKIVIILFAILILVFPVIYQKVEAQSDKITVAASIVPQETFVKKVGGDRVDIITMIPPGNSPANYAPSPQELTKFSEASIYFSMGVPADITNILPKAKDFNSDIKIVKLFKRVSKVYPHREFAAGKRDPHIWLSPKRVQVMIQEIASELSKLDSENKKFYHENAEKYVKELKEVDKKIQKSLTNLKTKAFIVYHPAFGYFADEYGLNMVAIEKGGKKATPKRLQEIIDLARKKNIKVIFYQAEVDSKQSQALAEELGGRTIKLDPLSADYIQNLQKMAKMFNSVLD